MTDLLEAVPLPLSSCVTVEEVLYLSEPHWKSGAGSRLLNVPDC